MKIEILTWVLAVSSLGGHVMEAKTNIKKQSFGMTPEGGAADLYTLRNRKGMEVAITNYGGIVVQLRVPDRKGNLADVVLGYDDLDGYIHDKAYLGALIGRYGNRIAQGKFSLGGKTYTIRAITARTPFTAGARASTRRFGGQPSTRAKVGLVCNWST